MLFDLILILVSKLIPVSSFFSLAMKRNILNFTTTWMFCQTTDQRWQSIIQMFANGIFFFRISLRTSTKFFLTSSLLITNASFIFRLLVKKQWMPPLNPLLLLLRTLTLFLKVYCFGCFLFQTFKI